MITKETIASANERMKRIEIKGKNYATVAARVAAFREMCPNGLITTEIVTLESGVVLMKATIYDEGRNELATGLAYEKENANYINKTSFIEVCETSAVGRALGFLGIGSDADIMSAEELVAAMMNQDAPKKEQHKKGQHKEETQGEPEQPIDLYEMISEKERLILENLAMKAKLDVANIPGWPDINRGTYINCINECNKAIDENRRKNL